MKRMTIGLTIVILLLIFLLMGCGTIPNNNATAKNLSQTISTELLTQLPKETPDQFMKDYLKNYTLLITLSDQQLAKLLTNPDKYSNLVIGKERAKVMNLKSVKVLNVKTLEQNNEYALVSVQYEFTFADISSPIPYYNIVLMGQQNGKWYMDSDMSHYSKQQIQAISQKMENYTQQFIDSPTGQALEKRTQEIEQTNQATLQSDEYKLSQELQSRQTELAKHQMSALS